MKYDILKQKIEDIEYQIKLAHEGVAKAEYNIKNADRLGISCEKLNQYIEDSRYYATKLYNAEKAHTAFVNCYKDGITPSNFNHTYFKCTLPYEVVNENASYQTSIVVDENTVKLFANGVDYQNAIECLDNNDVLDIKSKYKMEPLEDDLEYKEVVVEAIGDSFFSSNNMPITTQVKGEVSYKGLISSSTIPSCYSIDGTSFKDLDGNEFKPEIPTFDNILNLQKEYLNKRREFQRYVNLEFSVAKKLEKAVDVVNGYMNKNNGMSK